MKFTSRKGIFLQTILALYIFLCIYLIVNQQFKLTLIPPLFFILFYIGTYYKIENGVLYYYYGFFIADTINIYDIKIIVKDKSYPLKSNNFALASKGLIIRYNKYDEIYISPKTNETFIAEILKINPNILVTEQM